MTVDGVSTAVAKQEEIIRQSNNQTIELEILNKNLQQQIKELSEKLNVNIIYFTNLYLIYYQAIYMYDKISIF